MTAPLERTAWLRGALARRRREVTEHQTALDAFAGGSSVVIDLAGTLPKGIDRETWERTCDRCRHVANDGEAFEVFTETNRAIDTQSRVTIIVLLCAGCAAAEGTFAAGEVAR